MFKDDYIIRMVEAFGEILRKVFTFEDEGHFKEAHDEIDAALKKLGVSEMFVKTLPTSSLTQFVRRPGQDNAKKLIMLSRLVGADAHVYKMEGDKFTAHDLFRISLEILDYAKDDADDDQLEDINKDVESVKYYIGENIKNDPETPLE